MINMAKHILVVDDDQDISLMLHDRLKLLGFHVSTAGHGAEGIAMFEIMKFDGILLDIQMPVMDGLTMLEKVRERYPNIPVIMMTAELNKEKILQAMERGANDYLLKPIDFDLLVKKWTKIFWTEEVHRSEDSAPPFPP